MNPLRLAFRFGPLDNHFLLRLTEKSAADLSGGGRNNGRPPLLRSLPSVVKSHLPAVRRPEK